MVVMGQAVPPPAGASMMARERDWKHWLLSQTLHALHSDTTQFTRQAWTLHDWVARIGLQLRSTRLRDCTPPPQVTLHEVQLVQSVLGLLHPWPAFLQVCVRRVTGQMALHPTSVTGRVLNCVPLPTVALQALHALQSATEQA